MCIRRVFIFLFAFSSFALLSQDTMSYSYFMTRKRLPAQTVITDIFDKPYKKIKARKKHEEYFFINNDQVKIDTVIYMDITVKGDVKWQENKDSIRNYLTQCVHSPRHSGDPNTSVISLIVNNKGEMVKLSIIENVKNPCDNDWKIVAGKLKLTPVLSKKYTEYIVRRDDICYCECVVDPDK